MARTTRPTLENRFSINLSGEFLTPGEQARLYQLLLTGVMAIAVTFIWGAKRLAPSDKPCTRELLGVPPGHLTRAKTSHLSSLDSPQMSGASGQVLGYTVELSDCADGEEEVMRRPAAALPIVLPAVLLVGALLATALWTLNFRAVQSQTRAESEVVTATMEVQEGEPYPSESEVFLYVAGEDELAVTLREEMLARLRDDLAFTQVTLLEELPEQAEFPVLVVEVQEKNGWWTPLHARARLQVSFVYASDGDASWRDGGPIAIEHRDERPIIRVRGRLDVEDTARGLISRRAYWGYLGERIAGEAVSALSQALSEG